MGNKLGRPTILTEDVASKLVVAFHMGMNIQQACRVAGIYPSTYYDRLEVDKDFSDRMQDARDYLSKVARRQITAAVERGDMTTVRWYLERRDKDEFSVRTELTGKDGRSLVEQIDPAEKRRLDAIWSRKHLEPYKRIDRGSGTGESQSVPS